MVSNDKIDFTANEMRGKAFKEDMIYINSCLAAIFDVCSENLYKGYAFITIRTPEAIKELKSKGFEVEKGNCFDNCYKVSWLSSEEEQA